MAIITEKEKKSSHFNGDRRYLLECYLRGLKHFPKIRDTRRLAEIFGCARRTVQREIKRGTVTRLDSELREYEAYSSEFAQGDADEKKRAKGAPLKIGFDRRLEAEIVRLVKEKHYSPYAAIQTFRNGGWPGEARICEKTLYNYIASGLFADIKPRDLPCGGARRRKAGKKETRPGHSRAVCALKSIDGRGEAAEGREECGHWEIDTIHGAQGGSTACLLTLTERKHRKEIIRKMGDCSAASLVAELDRVQAANPSLDFSKVFKTITGDCGSENLDAEGIEKGGRTKMHYAHPYHSWERGTNENHNRMIRRYFPKGTDFAGVTEEDVRKVQDWMNSCPRKKLGGASPDSSYFADVHFDLLA